MEHPGLQEYKDLFSALYHPYDKLHLTFDIFYDIMILMVVASCIAGAASALNQYLGVNYYLGALAVGVVILLLSIFGADLVRMGSSYMGLAILALSLVIYFYGLVKGVNLFDSMKSSFASTGFSNVPKAIFNGINYAAFQWVTIPGVLACGTILKTKKDCTRGMGCMLLFNALGLGLSVLMLTAWSGYFTTVTGGTTLPTLTVLMSLDMNWLVVLYCLVLFLCMISSGVVVVFGFINRFENAKYLSFMKNTQLRRGAIATAIMAVSMFISFAGLTNIVKYGYGYCGYWAIVFVIVPLLTVGYKKNRDYLKGRPGSGRGAGEYAESDGIKAMQKTTRKPVFTGSRVVFHSAMIRQNSLSKKLLPLGELFFSREPSSLRSSSFCSRVSLVGVSTTTVKRRSPLRRELPISGIPLSRMTNSLPVWVPSGMV